MQIAIFNKYPTKETLELTRGIISFLKKNKVPVSLNKKLAKSLNLDKKHPVFSSFINKKNVPDFFISIGGDGNILESITRIADTEIPIIGINTGRLGFLSVIKKEDYKDSLDNIINGNYKIESRALLNLETKTNLYGNLNFALNEIAVNRKDSTSMITIKTYLNNEYLNTYWADGLIISSPTGSTGYSLSCGGPIVMPKSENFIITPVAPHNLNARPFVIPDNYKITLKVEGRSKNFLVTLDSRVETFNSSLELVVSKEKFNAKLVKIQGQNYSSTLRNKLLWGVDKRNPSLPSINY